MPKTMLNSLVACSAMLLVFVDGLHAYHLWYYDCKTPKVIEKYSKPSVFHPPPTFYNKKVLGRSYKVLTQNTIKFIIV